MATNETAPNQGEAKQYLVQCDGCAFAESAEGRDAATALGATHRDETDHAVVVIEVPPTMHSR